MGCARLQDMESRVIVDEAEQGLGRGRGRPPHLDCLSLETDAVHLNYASPRSIMVLFARLPGSDAAYYPASCRG